MGQFLAIAYWNELQRIEQILGQDIITVWLDQSDSLKASKAVL